MLRAQPIAVALARAAAAVNAQQHALPTRALFSSVEGNSLFQLTTSPATPFAFSGLRALATAAPGAKATADHKPVPEATEDMWTRKRQLLEPRNASSNPVGSKQLFGEGYIAPHPGMRRNQAELAMMAANSATTPVTATAATASAVAPAEGLPESFMEHPVYYDMAYLESIKPIHLPPKDVADHIGLFGVRLLRGGFDFVTGYGPQMTEAKWLQRILFLETVAGVPGMVAGMLRHLHSLRLMRRDAGWIHTLLEEAENERMHLLTFFELRKPGPVFRAMVLLSQGIFFNFYFIAYLLWPKVCHSFVGYLEEEAVRTYTHALRDIDDGKVWKNALAPSIAQTYWQLPKGATMRDLILAVRADEACHSHVNHTLKTLKPTDVNPFALGKSQLP